MAKPMPLQAFAPGPGDLPPLQALWPLQAFAPMQWPSAACALVEMVMPARNRVAAAAAMAAPDFEVTFMLILRMEFSKDASALGSFMGKKPASCGVTFEIYFGFGDWRRFLGVTIAEPLDLFR